MHTDCNGGLHLGFLQLQRATLAHAQNHQFFSVVDHHSHERPGRRPVAAPRGGGAFGAIPPDVGLAPPLKIGSTYARTQPSDDGGSFFSDCGPLPVPSSLPFFYLPSHPFSPPLDCLHLPSFISHPFLLPTFCLSLPAPPILRPLSPSLPSFSLPPLRSRPLKSSSEAWRSAVSSLSGVWGSDGQLTKNF